MKLSMMSYTMARGKWGKQPDLRRLCEFTRELGLDGIDFVTTYGVPPRQVRALADDFGLKVVCYTFFAQSRSTERPALDKEQEALKEGIETAQTLGTDLVMLPIVPKNGRTDEDSIVYGLDFLASAVDLGRKASITVSFENRRPIIVAGQVQRALRQVRALKVTFDNGNVLMGGEDPVRAIKAYGREIVHAHFKDWVKADAGGARPETGGVTYTPAVIGTGLVDQKGCIAALKQAGYRGYINIEYDGSAVEPDVAVRRSAAYLQKLLQDVP